MIRAEAVLATAFPDSHRVYCFTMADFKLLYEKLEIDTQWPLLHTISIAQGPQK